ncbi:MAG: diacylglycerol kinase family lipid kinase [Actinomycetota bacterium]|nr:diacylglycerol kinase family lipid kinase [Actinomycetota bacterium]
MSETVFLVNPASGNGAAGRRWPEIRRRAADVGLTGKAFVSRQRGDIAKFARGVPDGSTDLLVLVGGDGTVNEAVNGLLSTKRETLPALAVVMIGTGRDFARSHGIPTSLAGALAVATSGRTTVADAGVVRHRGEDGSERETFFANVGSAGMSGAVARRADAGSKALGGRVTFLVALVRVFSRWQNSELTVELAGERRTGKMTNVVVANGPYHAGGMWLAPQARPDDGLFDVVLFGDISKVDFVRNVAKIYRGTHVDHPKIDVVRSDAVSVDSAEPLPLEVDGEQPGTTPARFEILPGALRVRVP